MEGRLRSLVVDALFPRFCLGCHQEGMLWCRACASIWQPIFREFGCPFCEKGNSQTCQSCKSETFLDGLSVFASYANPVVREAIAHWKYVGDRSIEPVIERWLTQAAARMVPPKKECVFAPVPLHVRKRRARGFDQAGVLADWCGQIYSQPVFDLLVRKKMTLPQAQQQDRLLGQMDGMFALHPSVEILPECVVLCDDVFTSGATMDAATRCLKEAGVGFVWGFVIAKGKR